MRVWPRPFRIAREPQPLSTYACGTQEIRVRIEKLTAPAWGDLCSHDVRGIMWKCKRKKRSRRLIRRMPPWHRAGLIGLFVPCGLTPTGSSPLRISSLRLLFATCPFFQWCFAKLHRYAHVVPFSQQSCTTKVYSIPVLALSMVSCFWQNRDNV
ncbi:hypothetical protein LZ32DRAFT_380759 [Colletotrichum eremochloae]|nr:hypothetical protein LZ32DRAFT_380759 [Colletotrichum eremochloae]